MCKFIFQASFLYNFIVVILDENELLCILINFYFTINVHFCTGNLGRYVSLLKFNLLFCKLIFLYKSYNYLITITNLLSRVCIELHLFFGLLAHEHSFNPVSSDTPTTIYKFYIALTQFCFVSYLFYVSYFVRFCSSRFRNT